MMVFQFIGPLIAAILYVVIFQKAGFRGAILAVAAAPLVGIVAFLSLVRLVTFGGLSIGLLSLLTASLSLLPLLCLAFLAWPPAPASSEK